MAHPDTGYSRICALQNFQPARAVFPDRYGVSPICALQAKTPRILHTPEHFAPLRSNPGLYPLRRESRYPLKKEKA